MIKHIILDFIYKYTVVFINLLFFWLVFWVFSSEAQKKIKRIFLGLIIFFALWVNGAYLARTEFLSHMFWIKMAWMAAPLTCLFLYFFIIYFIEEEKRAKFVDWFMILITSFFSLDVALTNFVVKDYRLEKWGIDFIFGSGRLVYYGLTLILFSITLWFAYKKYQRLPQMRQKLQYFFLGMFILIGANTVFNIILPLLRGNTQYYQFGDYSCIFLLGFLAYSLQKYKLFEIKVVLTQLLVGIISILLLFQLFLAEKSFDFLFRGGVLLLFLVAGWFLIKSVKREIKQREELKELNATLDQKVQERTKELEKSKEEIQKRVDELEKFYRLTEGRELRMIELKKEIKKLEEELKEKEQGEE